MNELVSIITPTYNCGCFISETIRSVKAQSYANWELIIYDDCSTDATEEIVAPFVEDDTRIRYFRNKINEGAAVTRNKALREAHGRWIAFLDSDDLWAPDKLEKQIKFMKDYGYHFSYHEYVEIDETSKEIGIYVSGIKRVTKFGMYSCCWPGCLSVMYDAHKVGLVQIADVKKNNDTALWLKVIETANCYLLKENLGFYRRRKGSITPSNIKARIGWHYILFHESVGKTKFVSVFWMFMNILGNVYKKVFYVNKYEVKGIK